MALSDDIMALADDVPWASGTSLWLYFCLFQEVTLLLSLSGIYFSSQVQTSLPL